MLKTFKNSQRGISLLEVMLSLSIIAIVLVMATRYFFVASNSQNINKTRAVIGLVISAVHNLKATQADYMGIDTAAVAGTDTLMKSGDVTGADIKNGWASNIVVTPANDSGSVTISTDLPSPNDCNMLVTGYPEAASCAGSTFNLVIKNNAITAAKAAEAMEEAAPSTGEASAPAAPSMEKANS